MRGVLIENRFHSSRTADLCLSAQGEGRLVRSLRRTHGANTNGGRRIRQVPSLNHYLPRAGSVGAPTVLVRSGAIPRGAPNNEQRYPVFSSARVTLNL